jgi:two-component system NtrC family sensor kinase
MKLAAKLVLVFLLGVLLIVCLFSWQMIDIQRRLADEREREHAADLVGSLMPVIIEAHRNGGVIQVQQSIEVSARHISGPRLRWVDPNLLADDLRSPETAEPRIRITAKKLTSVRVSDKDGTGIGYTYVPLNIDGQDSGAIEVADARHMSDQYVRRSLIVSLLSLLGVAGLCATVIYWNGVRMVARPLTQLMNQVEQIGYGDLDPQPLPSSDDELGELAIAINQMRERLVQQRETIRTETQTRVQTQDQLRHADRLGTVGTLAAGLAHELGTPLNVVAGRAGLIAGHRLSSEEVNDSAETIKSEAERMTAIIRQLLDFARQSTPHIAPTSATDLIRKTCDFIRPLAAKSDVQINIATTDEPFAIVADTAQIQQVVSNLLTNAIQAMPSGGPIEVAISSDPATAPVDVPPADDGFVCVSICDSGAGMTEDEAEHIFEPFFTTKETGKGTGLGLSIAYGIVREHHGWIDVDSKKGQGTQFRVYLPAAPQDQLPKQSPHSTSPKSQ